MLKMEITVTFLMALNLNRVTLQSTKSLSPADCLFVLSVATKAVHFGIEVGSALALLAEADFITRSALQ